MLVKVKPATLFLLIQDGAVVDDSATPSFLNFDCVNENKGFQVAFGHINEFGKREILGVVANYIPTPGHTCFRVSSGVDNQNRLVGSSVPPYELIKSRLSVYWRQGLFDDLCNLPQTVVVIGVE